MLTETTAKGYSQRIAALTPEKRALLQRWVTRAAPGSDNSAGEQIPIQPRNGQLEFPVASAQERMWFNHQWSPDRPLYNESFGLAIRGALDPSALSRSFDLLMERHEIFKVTFHSSEGRLFQRLNGATVPRMEIRDLRSMDASLRESAYEAESTRILREPFRLDSGPLFRGALWIFGDDAYRVIFAMHHIIFDGWSGGIFFRELFQTYAALTAGRQPELPPLGAQYADFAAWEKSHFERSKADLDRQLDYWKNQLAGAQALALPFDRNAPAGRAHAAGREIFICSAESCEALRQLAKEAGATLFMALLAVFNVLLARYTGQDDIVVGLPTTNRNRSALRDMVGVFINTVLVRTDLSKPDAAPGEGVTFRELLDRVRVVTLEAQANQELPLQTLMQHLDPQRDSAQSLVSVLFDLQKKFSTLAAPPGLSVEPMNTGNGMAKADLVLAMEDLGSELVGVLDYDAERFDAATARQMVRHFQALMSAAIAQPDIPVSRLPILSREEAAQAEIRGLDTSDRPQPSVLAETIARAAEHPRAIAVSDERGSMTYGELHKRAVRLAASLRSQNVGAGHHVALYLPAGVDLVAAQLAVMMAGAAFVPIDPALPPARVEYILRDCGANFVIVNSRSPAIPAGPVRAVPVDCNGESATEWLLNLSADQGCNPAYLIYTSGSTGQPKGVSVSHGALANLVAWHRRAFQVAPKDRATQVASISFDASVWEVWPYLACGASVHFVPRHLVSDAAGMRDWLVNNKITTSFAPTPLAEELMDLRWPSKGRLRILLTGGDRLRKRPPRDLPFELINNYGPTENAVVSTSGRVAPGANDAPPSIGCPIDNVWLQVVDRALEPVPRGVAGELVVGGKSLANSYWNRPELSADRFVILADGRQAYRTGDLCRVLRNGEIEFVGRMDTQLKVRGYRIEPGEIENALLAFQGIRQAAADARELPSGRLGIVAYLVSDALLDLDALRAFLSSRLPGYMIPVVFERLEELPQTPNGKIDRKKLLQMPLRSQGTHPSSGELRTPTERAIAGMWKKLLNAEPASAQDSFFQLGGDSLLATRFAAAVREKFEIDLPLAQMMSAPTVEAIAAFIDAAQPPRGQLPGCLILLRSGAASQPPLFLTPPASGSPASYGTLAVSLPGDRAVYGFEAPGLTTGKPAASVEEQARQYVAALSAVYPQGPCYLAGWSLGGPVAFEAACQLRAAGREVAYLALIDAGLPEDGRLPGGASMLTPLWWAFSYPFIERLPLNYQTLRGLCGFMGIALPVSLRSVARRGPRAAVLFAAGLFRNAWRSLGVFLAGVRAFHRFQPRPFDGPVVLFRTAQGSSLEKGSNALLNSLQKWSRGVTVLDAPGSHMTLMLDPKTSSGFAAALDATFPVTGRPAESG